MAGLELTKFPELLFDLIGIRTGSETQVGVIISAHVYLHHRDSGGRTLTSPSSATERVFHIQQTGLLSCMTCNRL